MKSWRKILAVAAKERLELGRDGRLRLAKALLLVLLLVALFSGWREHQDFRRSAQIAMQADHDAWHGQGARNPHSAAHFGQYAFRPSSVLAAIDQGVNAFIGNAIWMEAHYQDPARHREAEDRGALARLGRPSVAYVLQVLVPLVLVLLAFGAIAGEREAGTFKQALAQGASAGALVLGKLAGILSALAAPLLLAAGAALGLILAGGRVEAEALPGVLPRFLVLAGGYLLFMVGFLGLLLAVSAWAGSRRTALLASLGLWMVSSLLLPRLLADFSERALPVPPASAFWEQVKKDQKEGIDGHNPRDQRAAEFERRVLAEYKVDKIEDLPVAFDGLAMQAGEEHGNQVFDRRWGEIWDTYQRQERSQSYFGLLVPFLAVRGLSMAMAGTDLLHHRHFARAAEEHRRVINRQLNDHFARFAGKETFAYKADPSLWQEVPKLDYRPPGFAQALKTRALELLTLVFWAAFGPFLACLAANRTPF